MTWFANVFRYVGLVGEPPMVPAKIDGLPPFALRQAVDNLVRNGWIKSFEYAGDDAWVDYARVDLCKGRTKIKMEWDLDSGGTVAGPRAVLRELRVLDPWTRCVGRELAL